MGKQIVIIFSGRTSSGKTSVSDALSKILNWPKVSFGDYVRKIAAINKVSQSRQSLQDLGQSLIDLDPVSFCNSVLNQIEYTKGSFIIDGLRHKIILDVIKDILYDDVLIHIHLNISDTERSKRTITEAGNLKNIDSHRSESEVITMIGLIADLNLDTTHKAPEETANIIVDWLKKKQLS